MALEKYEFPDTGGVTDSWLPTANSVYPGSTEESDEGIISDQSSGVQQYNYQEGIEIDFFRMTYQFMPVTDKNNYQTFKGIVAGKKFRFTDFNGTVHVVTFENFKTVFIPHPAALWNWEVSLRKEK